MLIFYQKESFQRTISDISKEIAAMLTLWG